LQFCVKSQDTFIALFDLMRVEIPTFEADRLPPCYTEIKAA